MNSSSAAAAACRFAAIIASSKASSAASSVATATGARFVCFVCFFLAPMATDADEGACVTTAGTLLGIRRVSAVLARRPRSRASVRLQRVKETNVLRAALYLTSPCHIVPAQQRRANLLWPPTISRTLRTHSVPARHAIQWLPNPSTLPKAASKAAYSYQAMMLLVREMASPHMRAALRTISLTV